MMHMDGASHVVLAWPSSIYLRPHSSRAPSGQALLNGARAFRDAATGPHGLPRTETHRPSCRGASAHTLEHEVGCCNAGVAGGPLVDRLCGSRGGRLRRHCPTKHSQAEAHDGPRSLPDLATHAVAQPRVAQCFAAPVQKPLAFTSVSTSRAHGVVVSHCFACGRPWVQIPVCPFCFGMPQGRRDRPALIHTLRKRARDIDRLTDRLGK